MVLYATFSYFQFHIITDTCRTSATIITETCRTSSKCYHFRISIKQSNSCQFDMMLVVTDDCQTPSDGKFRVKQNNSKPVNSFMFPRLRSLTAIGSLFPVPLRCAEHNNFESSQFIGQPQAIQNHLSCRTYYYYKSNHHLLSCASSPCFPPLLAHHPFQSITYNERTCHKYRESSWGSHK